MPFLGIVTNDIAGIPGKRDEDELRMRDEL